MNPKVKAWMLANGWEWREGNEHSLEGYKWKDDGRWCKDGFRISQDLAVEMYRQYLQRKVEFLKEMIPDVPEYGSTLHTELNGLDPIVDPNYESTESAGYNRGMHEAMSRVRKRITQLEAELRELEEEK